MGEMVISMKAVFVIILLGVIVMIHKTYWRENVYCLLSDVGNSQKIFLI